MDDVNRNGANALLKMLEEPPERAVIFLIACIRATATHNPVTMPSCADDQIGSGYMSGGASRIPDAQASLKF